MYNIYELNDKTLEDLKMIAIELGIDDEGRTKQQLIYDIIDHQVEHPEDFRKAAKKDATAPKASNDGNEAGPKKRGRKRKNETPENNVKKEEDAPAAPKAEAGAEAPVAEGAEPKAGKKRGRKPKAEAAKAQETIPFPAAEETAQPVTAPVQTEAEPKAKREKRPRISRENKPMPEMPAGTSGPMSDRKMESAPQPVAPKEPKEFKEQREPKEFKEQREPKEFKEQREPKEFKEQREPKSYQNGQNQNGQNQNGQNGQNNPQNAEKLEKQRRDELLNEFDSVVEAEGYLYGEIGFEEIGSNGFGYDPLFYLPERGCTTAQISAEEKNAISHRANALHALVKKLRGE